MYTSYYGMCCNPFLKEVKEENKFESNDYKELISRFNYLKEIKGLDKWNTENFYGCAQVFRYCNSLEKLDLSKWKMNNVQNTNEMFGECTNLTSIGDVSNWDVSQVKDMSKMFYKCSNLECDCRDWKLYIRCNTTQCSTYTTKRIFGAPKRNIKI